VIFCGADCLAITFYRHLESLTTSWYFFNNITRWVKNFNNIIWLSLL